MNGNIFVAQPPLYLLERKKHKQYVLNEAEMRRILTEWGLDGTTLEVYDHNGRKPKLALEVKGAKLQELVDLLDTVAERIHILHRRGLNFADLMARRKEGRLPTHWIVLKNKNIFFYSQDEFNAALVKHADKIEDAGEEVGGNGKNGNGKNGNAKNGADKAARAETGERARPKLQKKAELHEIRDIEKLIAQIARFGVSIEDYFLTREVAVTGEKEPAKYCLANEGARLELDNIAAIAPGVRELGGGGMEIKRFKGLGEMNADQLWETTMDPARRVLLRVKAEEAELAERMFSVLMGEDVEKRRQFIEEHALEVKNLDI
jgi:DNA gyrase subunit B